MIINNSKHMISNKTVLRNPKFVLYVTFLFLELIDVISDVSKFASHVVTKLSTNLFVHV